MKVGFIGAGKVGTTLGKYLREQNISVAGYYSRTIDSAATAAEFTGTKVYQTTEALTEASDTLFIATPDGEIAKVWDCIAGLELSGKIIGHFSGSLSSHVFSGIEKTGAAGISIHPMYAFGDKFTAYQNFSTAFLVMEGEKEAVRVMKELFGERLRHRILTIRAGDKLKYHAAAAISSNLMIALFETSLRLLADCGFSEEDSKELLTPLVENNIHTMLEKGTAEALTGPVERGDVETVKKHLEVTDSQTARIYKLLSEVLVQISERKNPERDYTALKNLLEI